MDQETSTAEWTCVGLSSGRPSLVTFSYFSEIFSFEIRLPL